MGSPEQYQSRGEAEYHTGTQERAAFMPNVLYKQALAREALEDYTVKKPMSEDQVEELLFRLFALAHQYLLAPSEAKLGQESFHADALGRLSKKNTPDDILNEFESLEQEMIARQAAREEGGEKAPKDGEDNGLAEYRRLLSDQIVDIMRYPAVRDAYRTVVRNELAAASRHRNTLQQIERAEQLGADARRTLRQLRGAQARAREETAGKTRRKKTPGIAPEVTKQYRRVIEAAGQKAQQLIAGLSDEGRGLLAGARMLKRKEEIEIYGFTLSESREELLYEINDALSKGFRIFLGGPTGTGKTSVAAFAMREITEGQYEIISWSGETAVRDIFGKPVLKTTEQGLQTDMSSGPYTRGLTGKTRGIIHEEMTSGATSVKLSLKALWSAKEGDPIHIPGFNGYEFTKEEFAEIATGNIRGRRHKEREEEDPAIAREFKALEVPFMPADEMAEDVILPELYDRAGFFPFSRSDLEMVMQLCKAAELSQHAYLEQIPSDIKASDLYKVISPSGADITLSKVFLDTGTTKDLFAGWQTSGQPLKEYVREQLSRFIFKNPHFRELERERENLVKILRAYGFSFEGKTFYTPSEAVRKSRKRYVVPSEMGFLIESLRSGDDDYGTPDSPEVIVIDGERITRVEHTKSDGVTYQPGEEFVFDGDTFVYYGMDERSEPYVKKRGEGVPSPELARLEGDLSAQIEQAKRIMGEGYFFGPDEIREKYPIVRLPEIIPPIPFATERMRSERNAGMVLRLRCNTAADGTPLTAKKINELVSVKYEARNEKFLYNTDWYEQESWYTNDTLQLEWVFMAKEILPNSTSKNYVEQTQTIEAHVKTLWQGTKMPEQDAKDIAEWSEYYQREFAGKNPEEITALLQGDATWEKYAWELSELGINQHNRAHANEEIEHIVFTRDVVDEKILETTYGWTVTRPSDGSLVGVGSAGAEGAFVFGWGPGNSDDNLGVLLSRR